MARDWSRPEVEAIVADYFAMLSLELAGTPFNKAARDRALRERLDGRERTSVELKHMNISHILNRAHYPIIDGYKPQSHAQMLLAEEVFRFLQANRNIVEELRKHADEPVSPTSTSPSRT